MRLNSKIIFDSIAKEISQFYEEGEASSISCLLIEELLGLSKMDILIKKEVEYSAEMKNLIRTALDRIKKHEPIQYVLGKTTFCDRIFEVNQHVLIPRQETEELVDWIVKSHQRGIRILDVGTGSGCIAISLALEMNGEVSAWDVSEKALEVANQNARLLKAKVKFETINVLDEIIPKEKFDLIVSNPPYVLDTEKADMPYNVLMYEPDLALFVRENDPLIFYRRIGEIAVNLLAENGWLYFEINESYGHQIIELMRGVNFEQVEVKEDLNGKERMIRGALPHKTKEVQT